MADAETEGIGRKPEEGSPPPPSPAVRPDKGYRVLRRCHARIGTQLLRFEEGEVLDGSRLRQGQELYAGGGPVEPVR